MKTEKIINIRSRLILLTGTAYCAVGGLLLAEFAEIVSILGPLPLTILIISGSILVVLIKQSRGAWDEYTKDLFFKCNTLAYGLTSISLGLLVGFSGENGMVTVNCKSSLGHIDARLWCSGNPIRVRWFWREVIWETT